MAMTKDLKIGFALGYNVGKEIADIFGIKNAKKINIHFEANSIVTMEVEFYPEIDEIKQIETALS